MATTDLISHEEAKFWLNEPEGVEKDPLLDKIITQSSALIRKNLDRQLLVNSSAVTEYHNWVRGCDLWPLEWPIQSVTSVHESTARTYDSDSLLVANTDYLVVSPGDDRAKLIRTFSATDGPQNWYNGFRFEQLIYIPGYPNTAAIPDDIKDVCGRHVSTVYKEITKHLGGIENVSDDLGSFSRFGPALLTSGMKSDLYPFKRANAFGMETGERDT